MIGKGKKDNEVSKAWLDMGQMRPSLPAFTMLFNNMVLRESLAEMFSGGYLLRAINHSGIGHVLKKCYLLQVDRMHEAYKGYQWNYIN